jgi:hypothetical protein
MVIAMLLHGMIAFSAFALTPRPEVGFAILIVVAGAVWWRARSRNRRAAWQRE